MIAVYSLVSFKVAVQERLASRAREIGSRALQVGCVSVSFRVFPLFG